MSPSTPTLPRRAGSTPELLPRKDSTSLRYAESFRWKRFFFEGGSCTRIPLKPLLLTGRLQTVKNLKEFSQRGLKFRRRVNYSALCRQYGRGAGRERGTARSARDAHTRIIMKAQLEKGFRRSYSGLGSSISVRRPRLVVFTTVTQCDLDLAESARKTGHSFTARPPLRNLERRVFLL